MKDNFSNVVGLLLAAFLLFQIASSDQGADRDYSAFGAAFSGLDACVADSLGDAFEGGLGDC